MRSERRAVIVCVTTLLSCSTAQAGLKELVERVPSGANAMMLMDVDKLLDSPMAVKENWRERHAEAYGNRPIILPPNGKYMVMAANLDLDDMEADWQVGLVELTEPPSMNVLAKAEGGYVDEIAKVEVVWSPFDVYFIRLSSFVLGTLSPAKRQMASRWIRQSESWKGGELSPYLSKVTRADKQHIVIAIDLENVPDRHRAERRLAAASALQGRDVDIPQLAKLFTTAQGVSLGIQVTDQPLGTIHFEFGENAEALKGFAKPLILEILEDAQIKLDDFDSWECKVSGRRITLSGALSRSGMSLVFSLLELPTPEHITKPKSTAEIKAEDTPQSMAQASQGFMKSTVNLLDGALEHQRSSVWMKKTARRIDRLPVLNVDPDALAYSGQITDLLREAADVISQGRMKSDARAAKIQPDSGYVYRGGYRGRYYRGQYIYRSDNYNKAGAIKKEERSRALESANEIVRAIEDLTNQTRALMAERYKLDF